MQWIRSFQCKIKEAEKILFSNFIMLWHVVLPLMLKREIVGYNYTIVCCLWCYKNVIPVICQPLPSSVGLQDDLQCLPSSLEWRRNYVEKSVNQAHSVNKGKLNRVSANWVRSVTKGLSQVHSVNRVSVG